MRLPLVIAASSALAACNTASGVQPPAVPSDSLAGTMFVANKRGASLSRIDLATGVETHRVETCENPHELTVPENGLFVIVACYSGRTLEVYHTVDLTPGGSGEIMLDEGARVHSALWHDGDLVVAGAEGRGSLYLIAFGTIAGDNSPATASWEIGGDGLPDTAPGPHLIAMDADSRHVWGTIIPTGEVVLYDVASYSEVRRARLGPQIEAIALTPDGRSLWVASNADNVAYRLDAMTLAVQAEVPTGQVPIRLAMHPSGNFVVSSNYGSGDLTVIDTRTNIAVRTIPVSGSQDAAQVTLVFSEDGTRLYAAETATDTIAEVDFASGEVLRRIPTGPGGDGLAVVD